MNIVQGMIEYKGDINVLTPGLDIDSLQGGKCRLL